VRTKLLFLLILILVVMLSPALVAQDEKGSITGIIVNVSSGSLVSHATVQVVGTGVEVKADMDGIFNLELPPGKYDLKVNYTGYLEQTVKGVEVVAGQQTFQDLAVAPEGMDLGSITVVAEASKASTEALLAEQRNLATVSDAIGSQEMAKLVGSDAADVMQRVTGVSVVDDKYVFVRGLGERYSSTMLNGAVLPSTQPDKKVVAMDMFPASLLENIRTEKSYTPDQPGEFSGGLVKVETRNFPRQKTMRISYSAGFNSNTSFKDFLSYPGGGSDWLGRDDGTRALPSIIPNEKVFRASPFSDGGFTAEELQGMGRSFLNTWTPRASGSGLPGTSFNFVGGNTFGKLGVIFALTYSNKYHSQDEVQNFFKVGGGDQVELFHDYDFEMSTFSVRTGLTANLAYELNDSHRLLFRNFGTHDSSDESRFFQGYNGDMQNDVFNQRLRFVEEDLYSGQVGGEHYFLGLGNGFLEWKVTYSTGSFEEPDIREVLYEERNGRFFVADESQSGFRMFSDLDEDLWEPSVDWTSFFNTSSISGSIKFGGSYRQRERDFLSRRFRFLPRSTQNIDLTGIAEDVYQSDNIRPDGWELTETTRGTDAYIAKQITRSAYGMLDVNWNKWRFIGGLRVESDSQRVTTLDPFSTPSRASNAITANLDNVDLLGSAGAIYRLTPDMNLRGSFSRTLNRPEFRELSPFEFTDVVGGRSVVGNPDLVRALIRNFDFRWEWFPGPSELVSASFFWKHFDDPIERFIEPTAQLRTSFLNADEARNAGIEIDARKNLGFLTSNLELFNIYGNYTFVDSEITIPRDQLNVLTSLQRPLSGQSRHVLNTIFEFDHARTRSVARFLINYQGSRITDVGAFGLPDIIQTGYPRLDANYIQKLGDHWGLKFSAMNLLDQRHEFTQGGELQRAFKTGRSFSIGISYNFFGEGWTGMANSSQSQP